MDDCPESNSVLPASLLYDGFGHFNDIFNRRGGECYFDAGRQHLESAVDEFAERMTEIYTDELGRRVAGLCFK